MRSKQQTIPAAGIERFTIGCPGDAVALNGGVRSFPAAAARVSGSIPENAKSWSFTIDGRTSPGQTTVTVFVTCLDVPSPPRGGYTVELGPATVKLPVKLERQGTADLKLGCPSGQRPTGYGVESTGGQQPNIASVGAVGDVTVVRAKPVGRNVELSLANSGEAADVTAGAQCTPRQATARLRRPSRRTKRPLTRAWKYRAALQGAAETLAAGDNNNRRRRCAPHSRGKRSVGSRAVSTWAELPRNTTTSVFTTFPLGRDGVWNIYSAQPAQVTLQALCLSADKRWR